jgi:hypothetical protein
MRVMPTSYPGGPPGLAARLERRDFWPVAKCLARVHWSVSAAGVLLAAVSFSFYNGRNIYGALALISCAFASLFFLSPFIVAANALMDVYYFDQQWAASYRPYRRSSADLTRVTSVTTSSGLWDFQRRARGGIAVPERLILLDPVLAIVSRALSEAARTRTIKMSARTRRILSGTAFDDSEIPRPFGGAIAKPPLRAWDDVRKRPRRGRPRPYGTPGFKRSASDRVGTISTVSADRIVIGPGSESRPELVRRARKCLDRGGTLDDAAQAVLSAPCSMIEAIKALRVAEPGLSLAEAKPLVYRHMSAAAQQGANQLWDSIERSVEEIGNEDSRPDS